MTALIPFGLTTPRAGIAYELAQSQAAVARLERDVARLRAELAAVRPSSVMTFGGDLFGRGVS